MESKPEKGKRKRKISWMGLPTIGIAAAALILGVFLGRNIGSTEMTLNVVNTDGIYTQTGTVTQSAKETSYALQETTVSITTTASAETTDAETMPVIIPASDEADASTVPGQTEEALQTGGTEKVTTSEGTTAQTLRTTTAREVTTTKVKATTTAMTTTTAATTKSTTESTTAATAAGLININTANVAQLDTLPGIGEVKAQKIIEYRNAHGPFQSIEDLVLVDGIGEKTMANCRALITVGD